MNSLQITYFLALCKYKNFTETANRLYVSQPAISRQIRMLEEELDVQLFLREYKAISLTEEGKILQKTLEEMVVSMQQSREEMYQKKHPHKCSLKVAVLQGIEIANTLRPPLRQFMQEYPDIDVTLECFSLEKINTMLRLNELDLAITLYGETQNDNLLKSTYLFHSDFAVTVHESHPFFRIPELTPELLGNERILLTIVGSKGHQAFVDSLCANYPIRLEQFLTVSSMDELITMLTSGFGIAVLAEQERFSVGAYRQFPLNKISASIVGAWHYTNANPIRDLLLGHLLRQLTHPKTT